MSKQSVNDISFEQALSERYLAYALSTITSRSLPDVRDGLKPVHRRLIYAMQQLRLNPNSSFKKSARVVGDVMGKFHPHGDQAIYDALVRLAQDFSVRYPLIDGQGNFGNIDGDNAAAMRYTEARLTEVAALLMEGIEENAIDFRATYDGESEEPIVFPAAFPNLLANGSNGIAVGMATSIPPHNLAELCQGLALLIEKPDVSVAQLVDLIPAPDFPTGGVLVEGKESILKSYETGRGSFRLRARWETEQVKGGTYRIIVTEIPFQVGKSKLIEKIAELLSDKKLPLLGDIIDESTEDVRLVLEPKSRMVDAEVLMESLFRHTDLETRISLNMNVLDGGKNPKVMNLKEVLQAFLNHRQEILTRRSHHRLKQIIDRLEVLEGYLIAYLNIDEVIRIIREEDEPKPIMMERFKLTDTQAEAILNMRLRSLRKLQEFEIRKEHKDLSEEQTELNDLLQSTAKQWKRIKADLKAIEKQFGQNTSLGARRTTLADAPQVVMVPIEAIIEREDVTIICSDKGWIRTVKGHQISADDLKYKDGDEGRYVIPAQTTDKLVIFATNGRFYTLIVDKLPRGRGHGEPLRLMIDLDNTEEVVDMMVIPFEPKPDSKDATTHFFLASSEGRGFQVSANDILSQTRNGRQVMNLSGDAKAITCLPITPSQSGNLVAIVGENRKLVIFPLSEVPTLTRGRGVTLQKYRQGTVSDLKIFSEDIGLTWQRNGKMLKETDLRPWRARRGAIGRLAPIGFPRNNKFEG
ncbi:MAG: DNA topoisomerase IV subunit A [Alphaproteobacteria bacterium]|jgi:topoisomerase-4 subunit A|nr:DNA topoisomerase IV subunit A [Alphaproteobacteria bacterium]